MYRRIHQPQDGEVKEQTEIIQRSFCLCSLYFILMSLLGSTSRREFAGTNEASSRHEANKIGF